jgi:hypothetical protein
MHYLTADNLERRGWPPDSTCICCQTYNKQAPQKKDIQQTQHLLFSFTAVPHTKLDSNLGAGSRPTSPSLIAPFRNTEDWWLEARKLALKDMRHDFYVVTILVHWRLWKERNMQIFQQEFNLANRVFELIIEDLCVTAF